MRDCFFFFLLQFKNQKVGDIVFKKARRCYHAGALGGQKKQNKQKNLGEVFCHGKEQASFNLISAQLINVLYNSQGNLLRIKTLC